jgi:surface protein
MNIPLKSLKHLIIYFILFLFALNCKKIELKVAEVTTNEALSISASSTSITIDVTNSGNAKIKEIGVVVGKNESPTVESGTKYLSSSINIGKHTIEVTGLNHSTQYYYRSFVLNDVGISYGANRAFTTNSIAPELTTSTVSNIYNTIASSGGNISSDGGKPVTSRGVCWSIKAKPTMSDSVLKSGAGLGNFSVNISGLIPNTKYYLRAFAVNEIGVSYGNEVEFSTKNLNPVYLDSNGVTVKAFDWAVIGEKGVINGKEYSIVSRDELINLINTNGDYSKSCVSKITDMSRVFYNKNNLKDISSWDVSNVINMEEMFFNVDENPNLSKWNVGNVINMKGIFSSSGNGTSVAVFNADVTNWNVSKVQNMNSMFYNRVNFNRDLNNWNVSNVTDISYMFSGCEIFNGNISTWNVGNVENMSHTFNTACKFNQDLSKWNVSKVKNMYRMFRIACSFASDISNWDVSSVTNMGDMFQSNGQFNSDLSKWNVSKVTAMQGMFWECFKFNSDLSKWNVLNVNQCSRFSYKTDRWILPKPIFTNCNPN